MILHCPYCRGIHRFVQQTLFVKLIFQFQILSAIFCFAPTSPLALLFKDILSWKQSHQFSSFTDLLRNFDTSKVWNIKTIGKSDLNFEIWIFVKSAPWVRQLLAFVFQDYKLGNYKKYGKSELLLPFLQRFASQWLLLCFGSNFKSI